MIGLIERGQAEGVLDPDAGAAGIEQVLWALVYAGCDVASLALLEDGHGGAAYDVNGPRIRHERVTREEARERYLRQGGFAAANAAFLLGFEDYSGAEASPAPVPAPSPEPSTAERVTGRPARTFAQWARDHASDFT